MEREEDGVRVDVAEGEGLLLDGEGADAVADGQLIE
jgi:hypothetical protein